MGAVVALTSFRAAGPGRGILVKAGQLVDENDLVVKGREELFGPVDDRTTRPSEPLTSKRPAKPATKATKAKATTKES